MVRIAIAAALVLSVSFCSSLDIVAQQYPDPSTVGRPFSVGRERALAAREAREAQRKADIASQFAKYEPPPPPRTTEQIEAAKRIGASLPYLVAKANAGDPEAGYLAGRVYETGTGTGGMHPDMIQALHYYHAASSGGNLNARYRLGYLMLCGYSEREIVNPNYNLAMGRSYMTSAKVLGYDVGTDKIVTVGVSSGPAKSSDTSGADALKALFAIAAVGLVVAALSTGGNNSSSSSTQNDSGPHPKYCMVPETIRNIDGSTSWQGSRAGYGSECP